MFPKEPPLIQVVVEIAAECSICKEKKIFAKGSVASFLSIYCPKCMTRRVFNIVSKEADSFKFA